MPSDVLESAPHSLTQRMLQPGLASLATLTAGAVTQLLYQLKTDRHKALKFTQISKTPVMHERAPHRLSQCISQAVLALLAMLTVGAGTAAVPAEDRRAQGPHLHPDDQDAGCAGGLPQPARLHIPAPGWHHQA